MNSLTSLGVLKDEITDPELLNALRRHTKQQNEIVNNFFIRNFFCKNNTQLAWADVEDNLILYINSRTEVPGIETDILIRASDTIQQNIVTYEREFQFSMTLEKEKDGPVLNDHDFLVPGYLISVSGHMFLQDEEKIDVSYDESNSYAVEALSGSEPDFQKMTVDDFKGNIFTILSHQAHIHWNLKMSSIDCRDAIKKEMKEYLPENTTTVDFFANLDKEVAFDVLDRLLKTTADLF